MSGRAVTFDTVEIGKLAVAVDTLSKRQETHEAVCTKRWTIAIVLLLTNLLAVVGALSILLLKSWHLVN